LFSASRHAFVPANSNLAVPVLGCCRDLERHRADHFGRFVNLSDVPIIGYGV
jgi:hypothetical protein